VGCKQRVGRGKPRFLLTSSLVAVLSGVGTVSGFASTITILHVATRAYLMSGLNGMGSDAMTRMGAELRARGSIVTIGNYIQASAFAADACAHRNDRILVVGYSLGATSGAGLANAARACGVRSVRLVGVDPPALTASVSPGVSATNFVGALQGTIGGAHNTAAPGYDHAAIIDDPHMQARIIAAARSY
jgi:hypothetical protein